MKPKRTLSGYALLVGVLSLSVVGGALIYGIYSALVKTQVTSEQQVLIKPLDGSIDTNLLNNMQNRRKFSQSELNTPIIILTPTPSETPTPLETPTPEITAAVGTPSGEINLP